MQKSPLDYDEMFSGLGPEIMKNILIRFYTIEDYFEFTGEQCQQDSQMKSQGVKPQSASMYYNRLIQESINDLYIMNKLICCNAKLVNGLLDNGRSIAKKKSSSWNQFLLEPGFENVAKAYNLLCPVRKNIVKYLVLSISNLLLKLSINMSKVSVIPLQKFLSFECLNIPTLSVIFLQYIQYKLFKSKNLPDLGLKINFLRQLPKITFVKLNLYKNNSDMQLLSRSQHQFINKQVNPDNSTSQSIKNMQYIQIHERSVDPICPEGAKINDTIPYDYLHSIDLQKLSKGTAKSPFTFQILQIMRQIVFPLIKDFKPDLIIYMQSYPNNSVVMDDEVRGLMICEMAEETSCNKMYVFKELGPNKVEIPKYREICPTGETIDQNLYKFFAQFEQSTFSKQQLSLKTSQLFRGKADDKEAKKLKKIFMNELCFTSLALIQKTSFQNILEKSHKHFFKQEFLQGILKEQTAIASKHKSENLNNTLKVKMQGVKMMIDVHSFREKSTTDNKVKAISLVTRTEKFESFYNLQENCVQKLNVMTPQGMKNWDFTEDDIFLVKYYDNEEKILVFIIKEINPKKSEIRVCSKSKDQENLNLLAYLQFDEKQPIKDKKTEEVIIQGAIIEGATYICSNQYLFRGFGRYKYHKNETTKEPIYNQCIHRLKISTTTIGNQWELVSNFALKPETKQPQLTLEKKIWGYGIFDSDNNAILFLGGYIDQYDEQKISKNIYMIKKADSYSGKPSQKTINVIGKTNKIIFTMQERIQNMFLNPFVFGIPLYFATPKNEKSTYSLVLNSNGYYLNLNHANKIFISHIKLSSILQYNGINVQNKLEIGNDIDKASTSIFLAEVLIKCMVHFPNQINVRGKDCCIQTLDEGIIHIRASSANNCKNIIVKAPNIFEDENERVLNFIPYHQ